MSSLSSSPTPTAQEWFASATRIPLTLPSFSSSSSSSSSTDTATPTPTRTIHISTHFIPCSTPSKDTEIITFLHGFPTSSHDFAMFVPALSQGFSLLLWDLWGYGDSDKENLEDLTVHKQADIQEALWSHLSITHTHIIAHDLGDTVLQELCARRQAHTDTHTHTSTHIHNTFIYNGGIYPLIHRPVLMQRILLLPLLGPLLSYYGMNKYTFAKGIAGVFSKGHPPTEGQISDMWESVCHREGYKSYYILIRYILDRKAHRERWEEGLGWLVHRAAADTDTATHTHTQETDVKPKKKEKKGSEGKDTQSSTNTHTHTHTHKVHFYWGCLDPVSGQHVADEIHRRFDSVGLTVLPLSDADTDTHRQTHTNTHTRVTMTERKDLGHWPFVEDPEGALRAMKWFFFC